MACKRQKLPTVEQLVEKTSDRIKHVDKTDELFEEVDSELKYGSFLDNEGYPTDEFLKFIRDYTHETMPILDFIEIISHHWYFGDWGFKLSRKYNGIRKLELHTGGWSGNESIIEAIKGNFWLTHFQMRYVQWRTGGHYYFEIRVL